MTYFKAVDAFQKNMRGEAHALCSTILEHDPEHVGALDLLGLLAHNDGRSADALPFFRRALAVKPSEAVAHAHMALALGALQRTNDAARCLDHGLRIAPDAHWMRFNLGAILANARRPYAAITPLRSALAAKPDDDQAFVLLAQTLAVVRADVEAIRAYRHALAIRPANAGAAVSLAHLLLRNGRVGEAYVQYEQRFETRGYPVARRRFEVPEWDGAPLAGRTVLLYAERDFGDTLQHIRFACDIAKDGGRIVVECQPELAALFARIPAVDAVVPAGGPLPAFDCHAAIGSLPRFTQPAAAALAAHVPYLVAEPRYDVVPADPRRLSVGFVWAGRGGGKRGCPLAALRPLLEVEGVDAYSLQVGDAADDIARLGQSGRLRDLRPVLRSFDDTAGVMAALDLVITIDTATVHLSGALGRPTWLMLNVPFAYRWQMAQGRTPWYPSVELMPQPGRGDWSGLVDALASRLRRAVERHAAGSPRGSLSAGYPQRS
ncbi:tetratricopeptide repeat protein [Azospirillum sp.]|uniref:tetratricopeptide repeat-containing glycosyltransferase family protein n=1 Tax=Azospirillum sp. TaxID=34012 RepID=UPI002D4186FE|nr:tetratricopeptide repeat protein [Azospirillum sp.]HYD71241.1 tetratricopeptide repeat protein [Azospirillum sp.]